MEKEVEVLNSQIRHANLYQVLGNSKSLYDNATSLKGLSFRLEIMNLKFLKFSYNKGGSIKDKFIMIHEGINFKKVEGKVYSLKSEDESIFVLEFVDKVQAKKFASMIKLLEYNLKISKKLDLSDDMFYKHGWFYCIAYNRREDRDDRGSIYRSITIFSSKINHFEPFVKLLDEAC